MPILRLFRFAGRDSRRRWWAILLLAPPVVFGVAVLASVVWSVTLDWLDGESLSSPVGARVEKVQSLADDDTPEVPTPLVVGALIVFLLLDSASSMRRLHDLDRTGFWLMIGSLPIVGPVWLLVWLGFQRGTQGPNRFGWPSGTDYMTRSRLRLAQAGEMNELMDRWRSRGRGDAVSLDLMIEGLRRMVEEQSAEQLPDGDGHAATYRHRENYRRTIDLTLQKALDLRETGGMLAGIIDADLDRHFEAGHANYHAFHDQYNDMRRQLGMQPLPSALDDDPDRPK